MVTLQNIADEAGVSNATVSNVLNGNTSRVRVSAESAHFEDDLGNNFEIIWSASRIDTEGHVLVKSKYVRIN